MNESKVATVACTLAGVLFGAILTHFSTSFRDRANRRLAFKAYLKSIDLESKAIDVTSLVQGNLFQHYKSTIPGVKTSCAGVLVDISSRRQRRLESALVAYSSLRQEEVEPLDKSTLINPAPVFPNYSQGLQKLTALLTEMMNLAK